MKTLFNINNNNIKTFYWVASKEFIKNMHVT